MDFKAALQAEIEAKKRQLNKAAGGNADSNNSQTKEGVKSVKVADLERHKHEEYLEKQKALDDQRQVFFIAVDNNFNFYLEKIRG